MNDRRLLACSFLAALVVGCASAPSATHPAGRSAPPTVQATDKRTATAASTTTTLGPGQTMLDAGTYRLDLAQAPTVRDGELGWPALAITVPDGWGSVDGWILHRGPLGNATVALQFWNVDQVYGHPCQWTGTLFRPGPTVDNLVEALVERPLRNATSPIDVTLDGVTGRYLEWSVPTDQDFLDCDADGGTHYFESWTGPGNDSDRYQQGPGQVDRLWILDVGGGRLVIDAFSMPSATTEQIEELIDVVESIRFER